MLTEGWKHKSKLSEPLRHYWEVKEVKNELSQEDGFLLRSGRVPSVAHHLPTVIRDS